MPSSNCRRLARIPTPSSYGYGTTHASIRCLVRSVPEFICFNLQGLYTNQMRRADLLRATLPADQLASAMTDLAAAYASSATSLLSSRGEDTYRSQLHPSGAPSSSGRVVVTVIAKPTAAPDAAAAAAATTATTAAAASVATKPAGAGAASGAAADKDDEDEDMK
jgi:hypothetical protein